MKPISHSSYMSQCPPVTLFSASSSFPRFHSHSWTPTSSCPVLKMTSSLLTPRIDSYSAEMSPANLISCHKVNSMYLFEHKSIVQHQLNSTCLGSLYSQNFPSIHKHYPMKMVHQTKTILQLQANTYQVYYPITWFTTYIICLSYTNSETLNSLESPVLAFPRPASSDWKMTLSSQTSPSNPRQTSSTINGTLPRWPSPIQSRQEERSCRSFGNQSHWYPHLCRCPLPPLPLQMLPIWSWIFTLLVFLLNAFLAYFGNALPFWLSICSCFHPKNLLVIKN